jgi:hypothetical protein
VEEEGERENEEGWRTVYEEEGYEGVLTLSNPSQSSTLYILFQRHTKLTPPFPSDGRKDKRQDSTPRGDDVCGAHQWAERGDQGEIGLRT